MHGLILVFFGSFPALQWPNPTSQAQVKRPYANKHPTTWPLILWSCETLTFASCTSNLSAQMFDFQKCTKLRLMLILSLQDSLQSLNLEITPIDNVEPHCPHDNVGGNHSWNEGRKLIMPVVCRMLESILWQIVPVCWLTTECQVDHFVHGTCNLIQYGSKLLTIHLYFPILPFWFGDRPNKDEKLCVVAPYFCLPIYNSITRIFERVPPCHRTTMKVISRLLQQKYGILLYCPIIFFFGLHSRWVHPK